MFTTVYGMFNNKSKQTTKIHLDVPFRTVSRGSRAPQGSVLRRFRRLERVEEGWRRLEKVRGRLEKVQRRLEECWRRSENVREC